MIPYLTGSSTALSVAAAVKQESLAVESELAAAAAAAGTSPPQQQSMINSPNYNQLAYSSPSNDGGSPNGQMQSMMSIGPQDLSQQQQVAAEQQMSVMMGHQAYGSSPNDHQQMSRQASMETGQMSFANVQGQLQQQQQLIDPSVLKVDRLTLHDKVPLPQLSLSDISTQLSMAQPSIATTVVNMQTANSGLSNGMVPIDTVMSEKPIIFSQEVVQQQQMVAMAGNGSLDKAVSMLSDGGVTMATAATAGPSSVIMSPPGYSHLISGDSPTLPPVTLPPPPPVVHYGSPLKSVSEYMQQQQPVNSMGVVTDLKLSSAAAAVMAQHQQQIQQQQIQQGTTAQQIPSPDMINPNSPEQKIIANQQATGHQLTANTIESFIQNMANHENQLQQQQQHNMNSMLSTALTLPSNSAPTYASLIADQQQQQQQMSSGVIATSSITNPSEGMLGLQSSTAGVSSMMMDTLPSALTTTTTNICQQQQQMPNNPNGVILTSSGHCHLSAVSNVTVTSGGSVISNNLESVSLPGMRGIPVQFTDNVEMTSVGQQMQQQQQSMVVPTSMIISSQSTAQTGGITVGGDIKVVGSAVPDTVAISGQTVLGANSQQLVGGQVQQQQQQASNICTLSTMTDAELISFINPSTFE